MGPRNGRLGGPGAGPSEPKEPVEPRLGLVPHSHSPGPWSGGLGCRGAFISEAETTIKLFWVTSASLACSGSQEMLPSAGPGWAPGSESKRPQGWELWKAGLQPGALRRKQAGKTQVKVTFHLRGWGTRSQGAGGFCGLPTREWHRARLRVATTASPRGSASTDNNDNGSRLLLPDHTRRARSPFLPNWFSCHRNCGE